MPAPLREVSAFGPKLREFYSVAPGGFYVGMSSTSIISGPGSSGRGFFPCGSFGHSQRTGVFQVQRDEASVLGNFAVWSSTPR